MSIGRHVNGETNDAKDTQYYRGFRTLDKNLSPSEYLKELYIHHGMVGPMFVSSITVGNNTSPREFKLVNQGDYVIGYHRGPKAKHIEDNTVLTQGTPYYSMMMMSKPVSGKYKIFKDETRSNLNKGFAKALDPKMMKEIVPVTQHELAYYQMKNGFVITGGLTGSTDRSATTLLATSALELLESFETDFSYFYPRLIVNNNVPSSYVPALNDLMFRHVREIYVDTALQSGFKQSLKNQNRLGQATFG